MIKFTKIIICLDMHGCPNRCRHCWLGVTPNGNLSEEDLLFVAKEFRPFTDNMEVFDWYREPDYKDNYKEMWSLRSELSDSITPHYELISIWRMVRDAEYAPWLYSLGVRVAQLTIFGNEEMTDYFFGRKGVYKEILKTIDILLDNGIAPRIQTFIYKNNIAQLPHILEIIENLNLEKRCAAIEQKFSYFLHQGSCDGENEQFYNEWITHEDIELIPPKLALFTLEHSNKATIDEVLGNTEKQLCKELFEDNSTKKLVHNEPLFFVDRNFDVYPNNETPSAFYCLGNLKSDGAEKILQNYLESKSLAPHLRLTVPISEMTKKCGNPESMRLFCKEDYKNYMHNKYCREMAIIQNKQSSAFVSK